MALAYIDAQKPTVLFLKGYSAGWNREPAKQCGVLSEQHLPLQILSLLLLRSVEQNFTHSSFTSVLETSANPDTGHIL